MRMSLQLNSNNKHNKICELNQYIREQNLKGFSKLNTIKTSGISYDEIKQLIENSQVQTRIVLIDACHSGLAAMDAENEHYTESELDIKGSYTLTSAASQEKAFFDTSIRNTFFTAELLKVMKNGLPMQQPFISLENVYKYLQHKIEIYGIIYFYKQRKNSFNIYSRHVTYLSFILLFCTYC